MNKKIIKGLCIVAAAALAIGGTYSYFQDTETSVGNKFVAGKLNLKIDNTCHYNGKVCSKVNGVYLWEGTNEQCFCSWEVKDLNGELFFNLNDVKPGDFGEDTVSLHVDNNDSWLCAEVANLKNNDNACENPEFKDEALAYGAGGETCGNPGPGQGELQSNILFTIWNDNGAGAGHACNNVLDDDEAASVTDQPAEAGIWPIADAGTASGPVKGGDTICYGVKWSVPLATNNIIQTDSLEGDLKISAIQSRHMEDFLCSSLSGNGAVCGDGIVNGAETCDDGNTVSGDGCSSTCQSETFAVCGNSIVEAGEQCDDGNATNGDGCSAACQNEAQAICGNGIVESGEQCDDGNTIPGDGCSAACAIESDNDNDGFASFIDCDDSNPAINPGASEVCDGLDNDCDGIADENNPGGGAACSSGFPGLCSPGTTQCQSGAIVCAQNIFPAAETCNNLDDNCNGVTDEALGGNACDGSDTDLCSEGIQNCLGGIFSCSDNTTSTIDVCNGLDDDCDGASSDGSEDPQNGVVCDGVDSDLCAEGTRSCIGGALACSDTSGGTLDVCNGINDDCDAASADGSEDPLNGSACDGPDTDFCAEGTRSCTGGALSCSDTTGNSLEVCGDLIDNDCDGQVDEGC